MQQVREYVDAIGRSVQRRRVDDICDARVSGFSQKDFKEYLKHLKR